MTADIIGLQETFLTEKSSIQTFSISGFHNIVTENRNRGGVGIYIKETLKFTRIQLPPTVLDTVCVAIDNPQLIICVIYVSPQVPQFALNQAVSDIVNTLPHGQHTVIAGDFNCHLMDPHNISFQSLKEKNFLQRITVPTTDKGTLLDHIYTLNGPALATSGVILTYYSYHHATYYMFQ